MLKLHEPIPNFNPAPYPKGDVTQYFGENPALYKQCCGMKGHNGWDITRAHGTPILCVETGKVVDVRHDPGGNGKHVRVLCESGEWIYGHLSRIDVKLGQGVFAGGQIGLMGNTGFVVSGATPYWKHNPYAGTHLHLTWYPGQPWNGEPTWDRQYPSGDRAVMYHSAENGYQGAAPFLASQFEGKADIDTLMVSDRVALIAAQKQAEGDKVSIVLWIIVRFLKASGY